MENKEQHILVIEDDKGIINVLKAIFRIYNIKVIFAENGKTGLEVFKNNAIQAVVCDFMLPDINGDIVLKEIRTNTDRQDTPFIFLSAFADPEDVRKGIAAGADAYITKPFTAQGLVDVIKKYTANLQEI